MAKPVIIKVDHFMEAHSLLSLLENCKIIVRVKNGDSSYVAAKGVNRTTLKRHMKAAEADAKA
jgi:hypothetical protein